MGTKETASGKPVEVHWLANLLFRTMNLVVLPGWGALVAFPEHEMTPKVVKTCMLTVGVIYIYSLLRGGDVEGASFSTLKGVRNIFRNGNDFVCNGCWGHYLAFDLGIAFAISQDSLGTEIPQYFVWPCLGLTLMFGPAGFLSYAVLKFAMTGSY